MGSSLPEMIMFLLRPGRVDIFNQVASLRTWMYYFPKSGTNRVSFGDM